MTIFEIILHVCYNIQTLFSINIMGFTYWDCGGLGVLFSLGGCRTPDHNSLKPTLDVLLRIYPGRSNKKTSKIIYAADEYVFTLCLAAVSFS